MPDFSLTGDPRNKKHVIMETFPTGITLGLFPDAFPIKYKIKSKVEFGVTKSELAPLKEKLLQIVQAGYQEGILSDLWCDVKQSMQDPGHGR